MLFSLPVTLVCLTLSVKQKVAVKDQDYTFVAHYPSFDITNVRKILICFVTCHLSINCCHFKVDQVCQAYQKRREYVAAFLSAFGR